MSKGLDWEKDRRREVGWATVWADVVARRGGRVRRRETEEARAVLARRGWRLVLEPTNPRGAFTVVDADGRMLATARQLATAVVGAAERAR